MGDLNTREGIYQACHRWNSQPLLRKEDIQVHFTFLASPFPHISGKRSKRVSSHPKEKWSEEGNASGFPLLFHAKPTHPGSHPTHWPDTPHASAATSPGQLSARGCLVINHWCYWTQEFQRSPFVCTADASPTKQELSPARWGQAPHAVPLHQSKSSVQLHCTGMTQSQGIRHSLLFLLQTNLPLPLMKPTRTIQSKINSSKGSS